MPRSGRPPRNKATDDGATAERFSEVTENYLLCLYKLWEDSVTPTVTGLTEAIKQLPPTEGLGSSVPSVAGMTRRMQKQGLVDIGADKRIRLTKKGMEGGEDIARRHRLAEWLSWGYWGWTCTAPISKPIAWNTAFPTTSKPS